MTSYQDCLDQILQLLRPLARNADNMSEQSDLINELGLASLQVMELIETVEDDLDISFPMNALPNIRTVGDLAAQLQKLTEE